jgi:hypothetical protein
MYSSRHNKTAGLTKCNSAGSIGYDLPATMETNKLRMNWRGYHASSKPLEPEGYPVAVTAYHWNRADCARHSTAHGRGFPWECPWLAVMGLS